MKNKKKKKDKIKRKRELICVKSNQTSDEFQR